MILGLTWRLSGGKGMSSTVDRLTERPWIAAWVDTAGGFCKLQSESQAHGRIRASSADGRGWKPL